MSKLKKPRKTIGFQISQLYSRYATLILKGVSDFCVEENVDLILYSGRSLNSPRGYEYQNNIIYEYIQKPVLDAFIAIHGINTNFANVKQIQTFYNRFQDIPLINIGSILPGANSIIIDNKSGMKRAVNHLIEKHHRKKIAFIKGPENNDEAQARFEAYCETMHAHSLEIDPRSYH